MPGRVVAAFCGLAILIAVNVSCPSVEALAWPADEAESSQVTLQSPDGSIEAAINAQGQLTYAVKVDGQSVIGESQLGLRFHDGLALGQDVQLVKVERTVTDATWENPLGKCRSVRTVCIWKRNSARCHRAIHSCCTWPRQAGRWRVSNLSIDPGRHYFD